MRFKILFFIPLLFLSFLSISQSFDWAKAISDYTGCESRSVATDIQGSVYSTGFFKGTVDFDPDTSVYNLVGGTGSNIYVSKLDSLGNFVWAKKFISPGALHSGVGHSIKTDRYGNVYFTGYFEDGVDFDPGPGSFIINTNSYEHSFICKLDSNGDFIWAKAFEGPLRSAGIAMQIDSGGNVYTVGSFSDSTDFDPGPLTYYLSGSGVGNSYVSKLNTNGGFVWAKRYQGTGVLSSITLDRKSNIYTAGHFIQTMVLDPGGANLILNSNGLNDGYITKLNPSGNLIWANSFGGIGHDYCNTIDTDTSSKLLVTGDFDSIVDFDPSTSTFNLTSSGDRDAFVLKLDTNCGFVWAKSFKGSGRKYISSLTTDGLTNIYIVGAFDDTVDFDPSIATYDLHSSGLNDIFITKLDPLGRLIWAKKIGGKLVDRPSSICIFPPSSFYITGVFSDTVDFDYGPPVNNLICHNSYFFNTFFLKLRTREFVSIEENSLSVAKVYPNPTSDGIVNIELEENLTSNIKIISVTGKTVYLGRLSSGYSRIDLSHLSSGMYYLVFDNKDIAGRKIIINN